MRDEALAAVAAAADLDALKEVRLAHAGDRSPLALANREIGALPPAAKADAGKRVGEARTAVRAALEARQRVLEAERDARVLVEEAVDVTLPWDREPRGARHPLTTIVERIADVFVAHGLRGGRRSRGRGRVVQLRRAEHRPGPPGPHHAGHVLRRGARTRASSCARTPRRCRPGSMLEQREPPIYVICPGRIFRTDELDATHTPVFSQVEGLVVDEGITMAHLKGTLDHFAASMFGEGIVTRLRPSYFPFTEPSRRGRPASASSAAARPWATRTGPCRTCSSEGWIEWGGCGMVNPRVLVACGIDPQRYTGFAFGMGIERTLMFRHGVAGHARHGRGRRPVHPAVRHGGLMRVPVSWLREYVDAARRR